MKNQNKKKGFLKALSTVAASAMLLLGAGTAAHAEPTIPSPNETGSLNIQKMAQPEVNGVRANGVDQDLDGGLSGARFKIERVNFDISTNAGWLAAAELDASDIQPSDLDSTFIARELVSGQDGRLTFGVNSEHNEWASDPASRPNNPLPIGLYLVTETEAPTEHVGAEPFLVFVPLTHPTDLDTWMYDVYVYPKNSAAPKKTVTETAVDQEGNSNVEWTITSAIPNTGNPLTGYAVADKLDSRLDHVATSAQIVGADGVALTGAAQVSSPADYEATEVDGLIKVIFTQAGLTKLTAAVSADPNAKVETKVVTKVNEIGSGIIPNKAVIYDNDSKVKWLDQYDPEDPQCEIGDACDPGTPTDEPETKWGAVNFTKIASDQPTSDNALEGAIFSVFKEDPTGKDEAWLLANALTAFDANGDEVQTFESDANGNVEITGLRYSNWFENGPVSEGEEGYQAYWLVEIKSPNGYELLANPIKFEVTSPMHATVLSGADGDTSDQLVKVVNVPHNAGFELPLTGGTGTAVITILGIALLAFVLLAGRRKRGSANHA